MNKSTLRVIAFAVLASGSILAGWPEVLAQTGTSPSVLIPAPPTSPLPATGPAAAPGPPVGLPRAKDYEPTPELRDVHFEFGSAVVRSDDVKILDTNAAWLRANPGHLVLIEGHCDNRGASSNKNELNMDLGEQRAQAVMNHLVARGIQSSRITTLSYGEERPKCAEASERCWSQNRRSRFLVKLR
jgi:peptidoglycan-associated lipoprotein